jgi:hypothetical protein
MLVGTPEALSRFLHYFVCNGFKEILGIKSLVWATGTEAVAQKQTADPATE